jgi:hypothetical protein
MEHLEWYVNLMLRRGLLKKTIEPHTLVYTAGRDLK